VSNVGFLVVDKPAGITSHDVVATVRAITGIRKVGHTGTLDPFATGVLPVAIGRCTRLIQFLDEHCKVYEATISLGASTDTGDPTGEVTGEASVPPLDLEAVRAVLDGFVGTRMQRPPAYSAVKVRGKRLYKYAREGNPVQAEPRPVRIDAVELTSLEEKALQVRITCGRGTYARVLAEEIAVELGTIGHLSALRRAGSGPFTIDRSIDFRALSQLVAGRDDWEASLRPQRGMERVPWAPRDQVWASLEPWLCSPAEVLGHLPIVNLSAPQLDLLRRKGAPPPSPADVELGGYFVAVEDGALVAVLRRETEGTKVARMFAVG